MFEIEKFFGFGDGKLPDIEVTNFADDFNSYAAIEEIDADKIKIDSANAFIGKYADFSKGSEILIHCSASPSLLTDKLGIYIPAKIIQTDGDELTLDIYIENSIANSDLQDYFVQAIAIPKFRRLRILSGGKISPQKFSPVKKYGGILVFKCSKSLQFLGGHIDLIDCGIPVNQKDILRPLTAQEENGEYDSDPRSGNENILTKVKFLLNCGDGAALILAKNIFGNEKSRIGNYKTHGKKLCRGAADSTFKPSNVTNVGGSSILIACKNFDSFSENMIAKYRTLPETVANNGKGLARCYIASDDPLAWDERLYAADFLTNPQRLSRKFNLYDFGDGTLGDRENPNFVINSFADVKFQKENVCNVDFGFNNRLANFKVGAKVICFGLANFAIAEILEIDGEQIVFDRKIPTNVRRIFALAEFENFTLTADYRLKNLAIMVKNKCEISGKIFNNCIIIAKNLKLSSGAILGSDLFLAAENCEGLQEEMLPENSNVFIGI